MFFPLLLLLLLLFLQVVIVPSMLGVRMLSLPLRELRHPMAGVAASPN
jgi:hypothetical protein